MNVTIAILVTVCAHLGILLPRMCDGNWAWGCRAQMRRLYAGHILIAEWLDKPSTTLHGFAHGEKNGGVNVFTTRFLFALSQQSVCWGAGT